MFMGQMSCRHTVMFCCYACYIFMQRSCCKWLAKFKKIILFGLSITIIGSLIFGCVYFQGLKTKNQQLVPIQRSCYQICGNTFIEVEVDKCCEDNQANCKTKQDCQKDKEKQYTIYLSIFYSLSALIIIFSSICLFRGLKIQQRRRQQQRERFQFFDQVHQVNQIQRAQEVSVGDQLNRSFTINDLEGVCSICLDGFNSKKVIKLNCIHIFHSECIRKWIIKKNSCPICRSIQQ